MKKIKIVLIIIILFTLSGCRVNSNVTMDYTGKVTEEVLLLNNSKVLGDNEKEISSTIDDNISEYSRVLDYRKYNYEKIINNNEGKSGVRVYKTYDNICSYFQDTAFNQYVYEHIKCSETDDYYEIKNDTDHIPYCVDCTEWPVLSDANLILSLPVSAIESNADDVNDNVYTWHFDSDTSDSKSLYIKIDKNTLKENEAVQMKKNKTLNVIKIVFIVITIIGVLIGLYFVVKKIYEKYRENKLDY